RRRPLRPDLSTAITYRRPLAGCRGGDSPAPYRRASRRDVASNVSGVARTHKPLSFRGTKRRGICSYAFSTLSSRPERAHASAVERPCAPHQQHLNVHHPQTTLHPPRLQPHAGLHRLLPEPHRPHPIVCDVPEGLLPHLAPVLAHRDRSARCG